jgi:hypothetical protein
MVHAPPSAGAAASDGEKAAATHRIARNAAHAPLFCSFICIAIMPFPSLSTGYSYFDKKLAG